MATAAPMAPTGRLNPRAKATAIPGATPRASASPMKLSPRRTTQVPIKEAGMTARALPTRTRCMNGSDRGSISQSMLLLPGPLQVLDDETTGRAHHIEVGLSARPGLAQRSCIELDDLHLVADLRCQGIGQSGRLRGRAKDHRHSLPLEKIDQGGEIGCAGLGSGCRGGNHRPEYHEPIARCVIA